MSHEVSCVDIHPLVSGARADVCAVGLWQDITVRVLQLPTLQELHKEQLGGGGDIPFVGTTPSGVDRATTLFVAF